jgi:penicillin-binding protein 1A
MRSILRFLKRLCIFTAFIGGFITIGVLYYVEFQLPDINELKTIQLQVPLQIFTHDGKLIAEFGEKRRIPLPYNEIPKQLIDAVLATEDQRYFKHPGIDIPGLMRAGIKLILTGRKEEGGSTITMQVARSFYLTRHKTFGRKLREILLALKIDHTLSKEKILELYLNIIYLGSRAYGVEAASEVYYGKPLNQLSIDQFAMLAGLPKAPSALNPLTNPEAAKERRNHVLDRMHKLNYIDEAAYQKALAAPLNTHYHELQTEMKAPYVAELIRQQLQQMYGDEIYTDGFNIYTTIDSRLQNAANQALHDHLIAYDERHGYRGPEKNLGEPDLKQMEEWEKQLGAIPLINDLEAVAVVDMTPQTITVLRANGALMTIGWQGLSWARKQVSPDYLGPRPKTAMDIVRMGDVIRILQTKQGFRLSQKPEAEAALVALNPTNGAILALTGGFDYQSSKFNRITNANRQPGSSFKPFIYSAAFDKGYTLASVINDAPIIIENPIDNSLWRPQNDTHRFYGPTRLRDALIQSRNLVSIRLLDLISLPYAINYATHFGFTRGQLPQGLSLALGTALVTPLQMASAYAVFANNGFKVVPYAIDHIQSEGKVIYQAKPLIACSTCADADQPDTAKDNSVVQKTANGAEKAKDNIYAPRAISAQNAFLITSALRDTIQRGTAKEARSLQRNDLAGKTGTTQNQVDAWFAGYNSELVAVAWLGFDQQQRSLHEFGATAALPMWMQFMQVALQNHPEHPLEQPPGIVSVRIDPQTGKRVSANDPLGTFEYFMSPYIPDNDQTSVAEMNTASHEEGIQ